MPYIYKITNSINGKIYIGKTSSSIEERWKEHKRDSIKENEKHRPLYRAMNKYGVENFSIEELEKCDTDKIACEREKYWIEYYGSFKNGYNATKGGDGKTYADYDLIYALFQEGKTNKEICQITGYAVKTVTSALEQKGVSAEERKLRGFVSSQIVLMIDKDTEEILNIFPSYNAAERFLNKPGSRRHITEVCQNKRKNAYGYKWKAIKKEIN